MSITKIRVLWLLMAVNLFAHPHPAYAQPDTAMLRQLYEQHLAGVAREHGEFDERTAQAARDLGLFLRGHDDPAGAYTVLARTVAIDEKVFGKDAPRTLADVADLASVAPLSEAGALFERAAKSSDAGAAARALVALGEMHASQGDRAAAAQYWRQALARQEAATGADSESIGMILNVLAQVLDPAEAIPLLNRALAVDRHAFGPSHLEVGATDELLAQALLASGNAADAVAPGREALAILSLKLGVDHPRTAAAAGTLAEALSATGQFAEAERLYRQALSTDEEVLGAQHPATLDAVRNLAQFLRQRGRVAEAEVLERRLVLNVAR